MKARVTLEIELVDGADLTDAVEIANAAAALLIQARDRRLENVEARGVERVEVSRR